MVRPIFPWPPPPPRRGATQAEKNAWETKHLRWAEAYQKWDAETKRCNRWWRMLLRAPFFWIPNYKVPDPRLYWGPEFTANWR